MHFIVRSERAGDQGPISEIHRQAFRRESEASLVENLRNNPDFYPELSLVAETREQIVGHILFFPIVIVSPGGDEHSSLALAPMAVLPDYQKKGVGSVLAVTGLNACRRKGFPTVIVLGHPHYYSRFGFKPAWRWNIRPPWDVPEEAFMIMELIPGSLDNLEGEVRYPSEFAAVS